MTGSRRQTANNIRRLLCTPFNNCLVNHLRTHTPFSFMYIYKVNISRTEREWGCLPYTTREADRNEWCTQKDKQSFNANEWLAALFCLLIKPDSLVVRIDGRSWHHHHRHPFLILSSWSFVSCRVPLVSLLTSFSSHVTSPNWEITSRRGGGGCGWLTLLLPLVSIWKVYCLLHSCSNHTIGCFSTWVYSKLLICQISRDTPFCLNVFSSL